MPKEKEINHPCHLLSLPSARRFWCRHCMTVFEDAITRWRHSRSCRYGVVNNFMRRRELEAKALQNTAVLNPVEARLEQSIQMCDLASSSMPAENDPNNHSQIMPAPESFNCFICHQKFASMEEMRIHVKYPCSNSKIVTSHVPHPKHSVPVFIDSLPGQTGQWQLPSQHVQDDEHSTATFVQTNIPQQIPAQSYDIEIQSQPDMVSHYNYADVAYKSSGGASSDSITPTNIYVNEQGETVIEVENLDLNTEGGELSLAHLLTQLSQQGIVFDKTRTAQLQAQNEIIVTGESTNTLYTTEAANDHPGASVKAETDDEEEQPTAEDAANTLAQLAGFRGFSRTGQLQVGGETRAQTQIKRYSSGSSSVRASGHYAANTHLFKYEPESSDSATAGDHSMFTAEQITVQQPSPEAANVKVGHEVDGDTTIQLYSDSPSVAAYITDPASHRVQLDSNTVPDIDELKQGSGGDMSSHTVLIQDYPIQPDRPEQLTIAQQIQETEEIILTSTPHDSNTHDTSLEANSPENIDSAVIVQENVESAIIMQENVPQNQISSDAEEYTTQTELLQDIVDSIK